MADKKQPDLNPTDMAGARRLLSNPDALDKAIESGLGASRPDPTYDKTNVPLAPKRKM